MNLIEIFGHMPFKYDGKADARWPDFFGVEFEVENCDYPESFGAWTTHNDGSLRQGIEFVLERPMGGADLEKALLGFYNRGLKYTNGPRTSTHIHINARDMTLDNLRSMILAVYIIEDTIFNKVGESRKWAGYATSLQEMDQPRLRKIMSESNSYNILAAVAPGRNQERYYGFNVASCKRHGTVEFRHFPGGPTLAEMRSWLDLIWSLKRMGTTLTLDKLLNLNSAEEVFDIFEAFLPAEWMEAFRKQESRESLMGKYSEIAALCSPEELERREQIIFLTKPLVGFVRKMLFGEEGGKVFDAYAKKYTVVGFGDFQMFLEEAYLADQRARNKDKPAKVKATEQAEVNLWDAGPRAQRGGDVVFQVDDAMDWQDAAIDRLRNVAQVGADPAPAPAVRRGPRVRPPGVVERAARIRDRAGVAAPQAPPPPQGDIVANRAAEALRRYYQENMFQYNPPDLRADGDQF